MSKEINSPTCLLGHSLRDLRSPDLLRHSVRNALERKIDEEHLKIYFAELCRGGFDDYLVSEISSFISLVVPPCNHPDGNLGQISSHESVIATEPMPGVCSTNIGNDDFGHAFNSTETKILHLKVNPRAQDISKRAEEMNRLRIENLHMKEIHEKNNVKNSINSVGHLEKRLLPMPPSPEQIGAKESPHDSNMTRLSNQDEFNNMRNELVALRHKCFQFETLSSRYKSVFRDKIKIFREACYLLFGFKIDMISTDNERGQCQQFSVLSMFSSTVDEVLRFQLTPDGMEIVQTSFCDDPFLKKQIEVFIGRFRCIPALLSNLTLELFQNQTKI